MWVRGHQRSFKLVPFESLGAVFYLPSIVTVDLSCISSETKRGIGRKSWFFSDPLAFQARIAKHLWGGFECQRHEVLRPEGPNMEVRRAEYWGPKSRRSRSKGPRAGWDFGEGQPAPSHQLGSLGGCCKLPQRGPGGAMAENVFWCILSLKEPMLTTHLVFLTLLRNIKTALFWTRSSAVAKRPRDASCHCRACVTSY